MDRTRLCFLNILRCALEGRVPEALPDLSHTEWEELFQLAQSHHVLPLVFEAVHALPTLRDFPLLPQLKRQVIQQVMVQTRKTADFLKLMQVLQEAGTRPLVVKGLICRNLYPLPDHRSSSDEDVLIPPEQWVQCHQVLTSFGLETQLEGSPLETDYEIPYRQTGGPLYIELHRSLFPPESESYGDLNLFFRDAHQHAITESIDGIPIPTLDYTDHLFYLICHAFKHFLHSGFGIRQVCDIILFANAYGSQIQWEVLLSHCRQIHSDRFAAAIFRIGSRYLTFDPDRAHFPEIWQNITVDELPMLEDLLASGVYGGATMSRKHSSSITLDAVAAEKQGRRSRSVLASLFPPAGILKGRYPYLEDRPWLLPAAWASRIGSYIRESRTLDENSLSTALQIGNQRLDLLKLYGILKEKK